MAHPKSVTKSSLPHPDDPLTLAHPLDLPDPQGFRSIRVSIGLDAMIRFSEERLALVNSRPGAEERRLRDKCNVPFEL